MVALTMFARVRSVIAVAFAQVLLGLVLMMITVSSAVSSTGARERSSGVLGPYEYDRPLCALGLAFMGAAAFAIAAVTLRGEEGGPVKWTRAALGLFALLQAVPVAMGLFLGASLVATLVSTTGSARAETGDHATAALVLVLVAVALVLVAVALGHRNQLVVEEVSSKAVVESYAPLDNVAMSAVESDVAMHDVAYGAAPPGGHGGPPPLDPNMAAPVTEHGVMGVVDIRPSHADIPVGINTVREAQRINDELFCIDDSPVAHSSVVASNGPGFDSALDSRFRSANLVTNTAYASTTSSSSSSA